MFTLTLATGRSFRVRKATSRSAWNVARALSRRHRCAVEVLSDTEGWIGVSTAYVADAGPSA